MKEELSLTLPLTGKDRVAAVFAKTKKEKRPALITFTMAYDPDEATSLEVLKALPAAGADIVEFGMPFSDPTADGPIIQKAGMRALQAGARLGGILKMVKIFREQNKETPLILMGYYNPILHFGIEAFAEAAALAGVDGVLVVDVPPEEDTLLYTALSRHHLSLIKMVTPTTDDARLDAILPHASGFLYYVSVAGITGTRSAETHTIEAALTRFRKKTDVPVIVGFGIKTPEQVTHLRDIADGVVVGSALVDQIAQGEKKGAAERAVALVKKLAEAGRK